MQSDTQIVGWVVGFLCKEEIEVEDPFTVFFLAPTDTSRHSLDRSLGRRIARRRSRARIRYTMFTRDPRDRSFFCARALIKMTVVSFNPIAAALPSDSARPCR